MGTTGVQAALQSGTIRGAGVISKNPFGVLGIRITHRRPPRTEGASTYLEFIFGVLFLFLFFVVVCFFFLPPVSGRTLQRLSGYSPSK